MATKQPTVDQHLILHQHYPGDCCLCHAEDRIKLLEDALKRANQALGDMSDECMKLGKQLKDFQERFEALKQLEGIK